MKNRKAGSFWKENYFESPFDMDDSDWAHSKRATQRILNILCGQSLANEDVDKICSALAVCRNPRMQPPYKLVIGKK